MIDRITAFEPDDRVKIIASEMWGTITHAEEDFVDVTMDDGTIASFRIDEVLHVYDATFLEALNLVKLYIGKEQTVQNQDLHRAVQLFVTCHRVSLEWRS